MKRSAAGQLNSSFNTMPGGAVVVTNQTLRNLIRAGHAEARFEAVSRVARRLWPIIMRRDEAVQLPIRRGRRDFHA